VIPGCPHHITQRGNHKQTVFETDRDRLSYLEILRSYCIQFRTRLAGYCLMTNHVHLIAIPEREDSLALAVGRTQRDYALWFQVRRQQNGHLWQNRFYSCPLEDDHLWEALRYVEVNPVRAALAAEAWDWPWSSARAHVYGDDPMGLVDLSRWIRRYNAQTWREALREGVTAAAWRERFREATRAGRPFGSEHFTERLEAQTGRRLRAGRRGRKALTASAGAGSAGARQKPEKGDLTPISG